ncbi:MAG: hypothetical protein M1826_003652 [Phylliscum demangeonii]|nr:MAG: hypothetical protein M1826_003652 [Phylliscum demangeonii]
MSLAQAKVESKEPLAAAEAVWTRLVCTHYRDPNGQRRTWESAERTTRPARSAVDGVNIIAILRMAQGPHILLQKQFRPPIAKICVEMPAGLIDDDESPEECALRELREETGYVGTVAAEEEEGRSGSAVSAVMFNDPGFCNTNLHLVHVVIDMTRPENQHPIPSLEENEFIDVFAVPLKDLYAECRRLEQDGYAIDARVGTLAEGLQIAQRWKL